jgi:hypothetical protein
MPCYRADTGKVVWRIVDGDAVLVDADTSAYYGLNLPRRVSVVGHRTHDNPQPSLKHDLRLIDDD